MPEVTSTPWFRTLGAWQQEQFLLVLAVQRAGQDVVRRVNDELEKLDPGGVLRETIGRAKAAD